MLPMICTLMSVRQFWMMTNCACVSIVGKAFQATKPLSGMPLAAVGTLTSAQRLGSAATLHALPRSANGMVGCALMCKSVPLMLV
jgi:hypothetical protein